MIYLLIGLFLAAVTLHIAWFRSLSRRCGEKRAREVLLELAPRLAIPARVDGDASLRFERRGFPTAISVHVGARLNVEASFRLTGEEKGWLTVSSLGLKRAFLDQIGIKDLQVGDQEFDDRLEVWGEHEDRVRERLRPTIRALLLQVDRRWDFLLRFSPEQLSIRAHVEPLDRFQVETLVGIAYQILDLLDPRSPGDIVVSKVQEVLNEETRCPVCGTPLSKGFVVRCAKCRSAHHADCWKFNGLCATFACGSQIHDG